MAELPLLATDRVALAIREGRQTQDRRPVKSNVPVALLLDGQPEDAMEYAPWHPGDLLYVREAHRMAVDYTMLYRAVQYRSDGEIRPLYAGGQQHQHVTPLGRWRPNIHMPKWAARTWVRVSRVWVERVRDISEADCLAEGVDPYEWSSGPATPSARGAFAELWESLYPGSWAANEYVWCCEFEREEQGR